MRRADRAHPRRPAPPRSGGFGLLPLLLALALGSACEGPLPALTGSSPADDGAGVPPSAWIQLQFAGDLPAALGGVFTLACDGTAVPFVAQRVGPTLAVLDPTPALPRVVGAAVASDGADLFLGLFHGGVDGLFDDDGQDLGLLAEFRSASVNAIPEAGTGALLGVGVAGLALAAARRRAGRR